MYNFKPQTSRELIDKYFSLEWCKDNLIIPISTESNSNKNIFWIAIQLCLPCDFIRTY